MKKYALLIVLVCCFASCSTDDWDNDIQTIEVNSSKKEINPTSDPTKDWDKGGYKDDNQSDNDGN
jgi:hypothetical protein